MITQFIFNIILMVANVLFGWLPSVTQLPTFLGVNLDDIFSSGIGYVKYLATIFPPFNSIIIAAGVYLGWKLTIKVIKLILGHRSPVNSNA